MGALVFLLLFFLGLLISTVGSVIGVVDAFRESTLWGVLALLVPFALLVFCIKFWRERKWARIGLITSLVGLGMSLISIPLMGGLAFLTARNSIEEELEDFTVEEVPVDPGAQPEVAEDGTVEVPAEGEQAAEGEEAELFEEAMLPGLPTAAEIARAELLPSTDPNERLREIEGERSDPYAIVTLPPPPPPTPPAPPSPPGGGAGALPQPGGAGAPTQTAPGAGQPGGPGGVPGAAGQNGTNGGPGQAQPNQPLPELPEPTVVASQVQVSGVAAVNGEKYAIVKAPDEPTSRYVRVGDRISNGTVLVKRIETRPGASPIVVFEERGEEIALPVGSNLATPEEEPTAAQAAPSSPIATLPIPNLQ
jgi:hypothetical protein